MAAIKKTQASSLLPTTIALVSITLILAQEKVNINTNNKNDGVICNDTPNWLDAFGNTCSYYATASTQTCSSEGIVGDGGMGDATENCCVCGGGIIVTTANSVGMPTTHTTNSAGDTIVNPGGTCGKGGGDRGNGICENGKCCSKHGWCGTTPAHCDGMTFAPTNIPSVSPNAIVTQMTPVMPTITPTARDWSKLTPDHTKFCGPKVVGGYEIAKTLCSSLQECGTSKLEPTAFGSTGNDCPKGYMCFEDIDCSNWVPSLQPSNAPSYIPTKSSTPSSEPTAEPTDIPTISSIPTKFGQTKSPTERPTVSTQPTFIPTLAKPPSAPPASTQNSIKTSGSYCGISFEAAMNTCSQKIACVTNDECIDDGEECFSSIICTYRPSESERPASDDVGIFETTLDAGHEFTPAWEDGTNSCSRSIRFDVGLVTFVVFGTLFILYDWL